MYSLCKCKLNKHTYKHKFAFVQERKGENKMIFFRDGWERKLELNVWMEMSGEGNLHKNKEE